LGGNFILGIEGMADLGQMLTGMIPVDNLDTIGKQVSGQVPNPGSAISRDTTVSRLRDIGLNRGGLQRLREGLNTP